MFGLSFHFETWTFYQELDFIDVGVGGFFSSLEYFQSFTAPWEIKFEQMVVIFDFRQKMKYNENIYHVFIKSIFKSW